MEKTFSKWIQTWFPILLALVGVWWSLHSELNELKSTQAVILERIAYISSDLDTLKADISTMKAEAVELERQVLTHRHGDDNGR